MALKKKDRGYQIAANIIMALWTIFIILPFLLLFMSSITDENVLLNKGYGFFPEKFSIEAYSYIFKSGDKIISAYGHTILYTVVGTFVNVLITALFAYPLSLKNLPGRKAWNFYVFFTMLFSGGLIPSYMMWNRHFPHQGHHLGTDHPVTLNERDERPPGADLLLHLDPRRAL